MKGACGPERTRSKVCAGNSCRKFSANIADQDQFSVYQALVPNVGTMRARNDLGDGVPSRQYVRLIARPETVRSSSVDSAAPEMQRGITQPLKMSRE